MAKKNLQPLAVNWVRKWIADLTSSQSSRCGAGTASCDLMCHGKNVEKYDRPSENAGYDMYMICIWYVYDMYSWIFRWYSTVLRFPDWNIELEDSSWIGSSVFFQAFSFAQRVLTNCVCFWSLLLCAVLFVLRRNNGCLPSAHVDSFLPNWSTKMTTVLFSVQTMFVPLVTQEISVKNYL